MFDPVKRAWRLLAPQDRRRFLLLTGARGAANILDVLGLVALGILGALLATSLGSEGSVKFLGNEIPSFGDTAVMVLVITVGIFFIGKSALSIFLLKLQVRFLSGVEARLASALLRFIHSGPISRIQELTDGKVLWTVNMGSKMAISGVLVTVATFITETILLLLVLSLFLVVDPVAAVSIFLYFALVVAAFQWLVKARIIRVGQQITDSAVEATNRAQDLNVAFREITVGGRKDYFFSRFDGARLGFARAMNQQVLLLALPRFIVEAALMLGVLGFVGWQSVRGNLAESLPVIAIFLAGGVRMMAALLPLQNSITTLRSSAPQAEPVFDLADQAGDRLWDIGRTLSARPAGDDSADGENDGLAVSARDLTFCYPSSVTPAIQGLNFDIAPGTFAAIVGPSGAGKSTLADLLLGIQDPAEGWIELEGKTPAGVRKELPGVVSYVPQDPGLVAGTIAENIALGIPQEDINRDRVREVIRMTELSNYVDGLPRGLDTDLGSRRDSLSGGQRQRLGLARALYTSPRLVVLDEATSALDASTEASVSDMIRRIGKRTTLVVIAHRLSTIQHADRVYVMDGGEIIAEGTFSEVRREVPMIEEYVRLMSFDDLTALDSIDDPALRKEL